jgi:hypothetical protein
MKKSILSAILISATVFFGRGATFTVTFTNDTGPGSLRSAISSANSQAGPHIIQFASTGQLAATATISLVTPLPTVVQSVSVVGRTANPITISGAGRTTLFSFASNTTNTLDKLILANGNGTNYNGTAISNAGVLTISSCTVSNHILYSGYGAGIFNNGVLTVANSIIQNNTNQFGWGGAIYNLGILGISTSTIASNATLAGIGAGIWNSSNLTAVSSAVIGNYALGGDSGGGGGGGGLGGGIFTTNGNACLTNCTIVSNCAVGGRGLWSSDTGDGGGYTGGSGSHGYSNGRIGGSGLYAGGGGSSDMYYSSFPGGSGGFGGGAGGGPNGGTTVGTPGAFGGAGGGTQFRNGACGGGAGLGAAVFIQNGSVVFQNCTIALNSAILGTGNNNGQGVGGGIFTTNATVILQNTIVARNTASTSSPDVYGSIVSPGFNFFGNRQGLTGLNVNDFADLDPNLGGLQNNGGSTLTCVPLPGSYCIDFGNASGAPAADQRGVSRPQGAGVDIGAVEAVTTTPLKAGPIGLDASGFFFNIIFDATNAYRVQGSSNLMSWVDLTNVSSGGSQHFLDSFATNLPRRFYRVQ